MPNNCFLFEVPSLRLIATHTLIKKSNEQNGKSTNNEVIFNDSDFIREPSFVIATTNRNYNELLEAAKKSITTTANISIETSPELQSTESLSNQDIPNSSSLTSINSKSSISSSTSTSSSSNSLASNPEAQVVCQQKQQQQSSQPSKYIVFKYSQLSQFDPNKYYEDVKNGIYPLTAYGLEQPSNSINNNNNNNNNTINNTSDSNSENTSSTAFNSHASSSNDTELLIDSSNSAYETSSSNSFRTSVSPSSRSGKLKNKLFFKEN
jgi:hypothetical protein